VKRGPYVRISKSGSIYEQDAMTPNEIRFQIMSQATEDLTGLWELAGTQRAAAVDELIEVVSSPVQQRFVAVYRGTHFASEEIALPVTAAPREIRNKQFWDWAAPEHGRQLRVFATPRGRDWYFGQRKPPAATRLVS
jgi:hypothetical protein